MPESYAVGECRHCNRILLLRPKALCWRCYFTPGVRASYGPISPYGRRGIDPTPQQIATLAFQIRQQKGLVAPDDSVLR